MTRRRFFSWLGSALLLLLAFGLFRRWRRGALVSETVAPLRDAILGLDPAEGTSRLTTAEEAHLWSLALVILPSAAGETARSLIVERLQWRATHYPGYAREFRASLELLEAESQRTFAISFGALTRSQVAHVVRRVLEGVVAHDLAAAPRGTLIRLALSPSFVRRFRMRRHLVTEILDAFYQSPLGWASLGYRSFPGACAGLEIYSSPPA
jgi:hypothetical protein